MRRRYRVTGRFYFLLLILAVIAFLIIRPHISFGEKVEVLSIASSAYTHTTDAVIIRDEKLVTADSVTGISRRHNRIPVFHRIFADRAFQAGGCARKHTGIS